MFLCLYAMGVCVPVHGLWIYNAEVSEFGVCGVRVRVNIYVRAYSVRALNMVRYTHVLRNVIIKGLKCHSLIS